MNKDKTSFKTDYYHIDVAIPANSYVPYPTGFIPDIQLVQYLKFK